MNVNVITLEGFYYKGSGLSVSAGNTNAVFASNNTGAYNTATHLGLIEFPSGCSSNISMTLTYRNIQLVGSTVPTIADFGVGCQIQDMNMNLYVYTWGVCTPPTTTTTTTIPPDQLLTEDYTGYSIQYRMFKQTPDVTQGTWHRYNMVLTSFMYRFPTLPTTLTDSSGNIQTIVDESNLSLTIPQVFFTYNNWLDDMFLYGNQTIQSVSILGDGVIGDSAFAKCPFLTNVYAPSITSVEPCAFYKCASLSSIGLNSVRTILFEAFEHCTSLGSFVMPGTLMTIGFRAFRGCTNLSTIQFLGNSQLTTIDDSAFEECTALSSITIPKSVTSIGRNAFPTIQSVTFAGTIPTLYPTSFPSVTSITVPDWIYPQSLYNVNANYFPKLQIVYTNNVPNYSMNGIFGQNIYGTTIVHISKSSATVSNITSTNASEYYTSTIQTLNTSIATIYEGGTSISGGSPQIDMTRLSDALNSQKDVLNAIQTNNASGNQVVPVGSVDISTYAPGLSTVQLYGAIPSSGVIDILAITSYDATNPSVPAALFVPMAVGDVQQIGADASGNWYTITLTDSTHITIQNITTNTVTRAPTSINSIVVLDDGVTAFTFLIGSLLLTPVTLTSEILSYAQNGTITLYDSIGNPLGGSALSALVSGNQTVYQLVTGSCLLRGTRVETPNGPVPIEALRTGDTIVNQHGIPIRVKKVAVAKHTFHTTSKDNHLYKVPKGKYGATSDVYLSRWHCMLGTNRMVPPEQLGLRPAQPDEYCDADGVYTVFHIMVEDGANNHLVVNGGCVVESFARCVNIRYEKNIERIEGWSPTLCWDTLPSGSVNRNTFPRDVGWFSRRNVGPREPSRTNSTNTLRIRTTRHCSNIQRPIQRNWNSFFRNRFGCTKKAMPTPIYTIRL